MLSGSPAPSLPHHSFPMSLHLPLSFLLPPPPIFSCFRSAQRNMSLSCFYRSVIYIVSAPSLRVWSPSQNSLSHSCVHLQKNGKTGSLRNLQPANRQRPRPAHGTGPSSDRPAGVECWESFLFLLGRVKKNAVGAIPH